MSGGLRSAWSGYARWCDSRFSMKFGGEVECGKRVGSIRNSKFGPPEAGISICGFSKGLSGLLVERVGRVDWVRSGVAHMIFLEMYLHVSPYEGGLISSRRRKMITFSDAKAQSIK